MGTCNGIAIQGWLRFSVGHEVEQMAEEDGWQECKHIACCSTSLPTCTQEKVIRERPLWRYHGDEHHRAIQSSKDPQQRRSTIGVAWE
jgi:hypothetical protein